MEPLRQTGTISDYCNDFHGWFKQCQIREGFSDFVGVYLFICGLEPKIGDVFASWHQYSCNTVDDVITLALKIDDNGLQDSFSPFDPESSFYNKELEWDTTITLDELMKDNEFFRNGKIQETHSSSSFCDVVNIPDSLVNEATINFDVKNNEYKVFDEMPDQIRGESETEFSDLYLCKTILSDKSEWGIVIQDVSKHIKDTTKIVNNDVIVEIDASSNLVFRDFQSFGDIVCCVCDFWGQKSLKEGVIGMEMVIECFGWKPGWLHCSNDVIVIQKFVNDSEVVKGIEEVNDEVAFIVKCIGLLSKDDMVVVCGMVDLRKSYLQSSILGEEPKLLGNVKVSSSKVYENEVGVYYEFEESGEASHANAWDCGDRYLTTSIVSSFRGVTIMKIVGLRSPFASCAKRFLNWAMTTTLMSKSGILIFEGDINQLDHDHREELFLNKERELYNQREKCLDGKTEDGLMISSNEKFEVKFMCNDLALGVGKKQDLADFGPSAIVICVPLHPVMCAYLVVEINAAELFFGNSKMTPELRSLTAQGVDLGWNKEETGGTSLDDWLDVETNSVEDVVKDIKEHVCLENGFVGNEYWWLIPVGIKEVKWFGKWVLLFIPMVCMKPTISLGHARVSIHQLSPLGMCMKPTISLGHARVSIHQLSPLGIHWRGLLICNTNGGKGVQMVFTNGVLHGNLKPPNIWMDRKIMGLELADLGLTRASTLPTNKYIHEGLTFLYRDPTVFLGATHYLTAIDMCLLGIFIKDIRTEVSQLKGWFEFFLWRPGPFHVLPQICMIMGSSFGVFLRTKIFKGKAFDTCYNTFGVIIGILDKSRVVKCNKWLDRFIVCIYT